MALIRKGSPLCLGYFSRNGDKIGGLFKAVKFRIR